MKNFDIFGVHRKIFILKDVSGKTNIEGRLIKKRTWTVCKFKRGERRKNEGGGVFMGD